MAMNGMFFNCHCRHHVVVEDLMHYESEQVGCPRFGKTVGTLASTQVD